MIQKPFAVKDDAVNATIMLYCKAVDEVVKEYEDESEKLDRIVVVDHLHRQIRMILKIIN